MVVVVVEAYVAPTTTTMLQQASNVLLFAYWQASFKYVGIHHSPPVVLWLLKHMLHPQQTQRYRRQVIYCFCRLAGWLQVCWQAMLQSRSMRTSTPTCCMLWHTTLIVKSSECITGYCLCFCCALLISYDQSTTKGATKSTGCFR